MSDLSDQEREAQFAEAADWFIQCLKDVSEHKVVRGLPEAEGAYLQARAALAAREDTERPEQPKGWASHETLEALYAVLDDEGWATAASVACLQRRSVASTAASLSHLAREGYVQINGTLRETRYAPIRKEYDS